MRPYDYGNKLLAASEMRPYDYGPTIAEIDV
jgi:hypothetical protein